MGKRYTNVVDMARDVVGDDCADRVAAHIRKISVSNFLFGTRIKLGQSQAFVAKRMGCSQSKVGRIERSPNKKIKSEDVLLYLQALGCIYYNQEPKLFHRRKK